MYLNISAYISKAPKFSFGKPTEEISTKMNPQGRSSHALTMRNSTFGGDYQKARLFEKRILESKGLSTFKSIR